MVPVFTPRSASDLSVAMALLDGYGIPYFVHNYHFGSLFPAPVVELYNARTILVPDEVAADARRLLDDLRPGLESTPGDMSPRDRVRVLVEFFLLGGWFVPGSKWPRDRAQR